MATPLDQQGLTPLDQQSLSGFAMPDPYGLQDYCQSLLPDAPSIDQVIEALELWKFTQEAYPKSKRKCVVCSWDVETPKEELRKHHFKHIEVHLRRQLFVSRPSPFWPTNDVYQLDSAFGKSYFSFFTSWEYEIGPVVNPMPPCKRDTSHRGYNHVSAELAWGKQRYCQEWQARTLFCNGQPTSSLRWSTPNTP